MKYLMLALFSGLFSNHALAIDCHGTEPFWGATLSSDQIVIESIPDTLQILPVSGVSAASGYTADFIEVYSNMSGPVAVVVSKTCDDSMSDFLYPKQVILFTGSETLYGCCGDAVESDKDSSL